MKENKILPLLLLVHFFLCLLIVYLSPRPDPLTAFLFLLSNGLLFLLLKKEEEKKDKELEKRIDRLVDLVQSFNRDVDKYEVEDSDFGKLRDEIVKIIVENKQLTGQARKNQEILQEYTEDIAHQIKTPLTGVLLLLDLMEEDREHEEQYREMIRENVNRLHHLADLLLKMAALDSGTIAMKKEEVSAKNLVEDIIGNMEIYFPEAEENISVYGEDFPLLCDKNWTYEAVFNVVKNGLEASKGQKMNIYLEKTNLFKSILVEDFGQGMDRETEKKAYKRFYKADPNSKGYGIGLPMARTILRKQGGDLVYHRGKTSNTFALRFHR